MEFSKIKLVFNFKNADSLGRGYHIYYPLSTSISTLYLSN